MPKTTSKKAAAIVPIKSLTALKKALGHIKNAPPPQPMAAFAAFPSATTFQGQDTDEHIVLLLRQHPAVFIPRGIILLFMVILPFVLLPLLGTINFELGAGDTVFAIGVVILWLMICISYVFITFFMWFFNVNIVTNQRIIDVDFHQLFDHRVSECQLEKIQDVTHSSVGMWAVVFDFGTVYIQTAAEQREFDFLNVPRPRDVQDTINDLIELKQQQP